MSFEWSGDLGEWTDRFGGKLGFAGFRRVEIA